MSRFHRLLIGLSLPVFTLILGWQLGMRYASQGSERETFGFSAQTGSGQIIRDPEREVDIGLMWDVWKLLLSRYIAPEEMKPGAMVTGAIRGMVDAVGDPYTVFMDKEENTDFRDLLSGHLQGIGAELAMRKGLVVVVAPLKGSPAEKAGLRPEDIIVEVDGESTEGQSLQDVVGRIRGEKGTTVRLSIARAGEEEAIEASIVREDIHVPSTAFTAVQSSSGTVAHVEVNQFGNETIPEIQAIIRTEIMGKDFDGLVLDLRYNGGGYLEGAVDLASMFLREGRVVSVDRRDATQHHDATGRPLLPDIPLVVLINEGSASASEIVAGALQDHKRATVIGMTSFGKGTVQEVVDLPGGSSLRVTIARWLTPGGRDLSKEGITPDIAVDRTKEDLDADRDPQLRAALEWLLDKQDVSREPGYKSPIAPAKE